MAIISPFDDPATSHPLAAANAAAGASQPPASNPESSLFDDLGGTAAYADAGTSTPWSSHPPYASTATPYGGGVSNSSSSPMLSGSMMDTFFLPPAMAEPTSYWYPKTQLGFPPCFVPPAAPFAPQGAMPPPVLVPMQAMRVEPPYSYHPETQGPAVSAAAGGGGGGEAFIVHAVPDAQKAAQEATAPTPRRRGRPRKDAAAPAKPKPAFKPPPKRATVRSKRAASRPTASVAGSSATMAGQVQVQQPDQAANDVEIQVEHPDHQAASAVALANSNQPNPCTNPMASLYQDDIQEQWQLQPTCSNSLSAGDQAAAAVVWQQEVMVPYGPYADTSVAGVRFQPTDQELIFYLRLKHAGREMPVEFFKEFDVYQATPATSRAVCGEVDGFWYAFSPRFRKYKNGERPARSVLEAAGGMQVGYWKSNTKVDPVRAGGSKDGALIGNVTSLTFHLGRQPKGTKTPWKMKEYAIPENQHAPDGLAMRLNDWVVCKLFYKERVIKNGAEEEDQSGEASSDKNDGRAEGDEATSMLPDFQTLAENSEQDLCVEDYLGYGETSAHLLGSCSYYY